MELPFHVAEAVVLMVGLCFLGVYSRSEDATYLLVAALCGLSAVVAFLLSWPWLLLVGGILTAALLLLTAGGRKGD